MRAVLVHDWLTGMRGGEKVLEALAELFPAAPILTLVHRPGSVSRAIEAHPIQVSWLGRLPGAHQHYRRLLPLYPAAMATLKVPPADLVLSSSHAAAKAVRKPPGAVHVCYCYTPMRYLWDLYGDYFGPGRAGLLTRAAMRLLRGPLRRWDVATAGGVDHWLAVSAHVGERIQRIYGRDSTVLYPWVDLDRFTPGPESPGERYLVVSALVPYKRLELAIAAAAQLGRGLDVVGSGPDEARLRQAAAAAGGDVRFLGWLGDAELARVYRQARALLMPGEEDFGIAPLEAMASGRPVVAYAIGGALETVVEGETGLLFAPQTAEALAAAMVQCERIAWPVARLRSQAESFSRARFVAAAREWLATHVTKNGRRVDRRPSVATGAGR
jgi:glycosyltransferase involved in cell wall biosynthesis